MIKPFLAYDRGMVADNLPPARWRFAVTAVLAALGQLITWVAGTVTQMNWFADSAGWWHTARFLGSVLTRTQSAALLVWAALTGILVAAGTRARLRNARLPLAAFAAGALVPLGLTLLRGAMGRAWPGLDGPVAAPLMTLLLVVYAVLIPWLLGRLITRATPAPPPASVRPL